MLHAGHAGLLTRSRADVPTGLRAHIGAFLLAREACSFALTRARVLVQYHARSRVLTRAHACLPASLCLHTSVFACLHACVAMCQHACIPVRVSRAPVRWSMRALSLQT